MQIFVSACVHVSTFLESGTRRFLFFRVTHSSLSSLSPACSLLSIFFPSSFICYQFLSHIPDLYKIRTTWLLISSCSKNFWVYKSRIFNILKKAFLTHNIYLYLTKICPGKSVLNLSDHLEYSCQVKVASGNILFYIYRL